MLPFKDGALKIADKTGCAIVPISMNNTAEIFENHLPKKGTKGFPKIRKTHVIIEYGKPIYLIGKNASTLVPTARISFRKLSIKTLHCSKACTKGAKNHDNTKFNIIDRFL